MVGSLRTVRSADQAPSAVVLDGVSKRYQLRGPLVLRDIECSMQPGALTYVQGDNGSGKSTLLRILAGVTVPTRGRVTGLPARVGYVPERFPPGLRFTARQYLGHLGRVRGLPDRLTAARSGELLDLLGAPQIADTPMWELSKGTSQKVAIVQALVAEPALLVLDEAFTGLDRNAQLALMEQVRARRNAGGVVVFTDHSQRARALTPDVSLVLVAGVLQPRETAPTEAVMLVVLAGQPDGFDAAGHPGVRHVETTSNSILLHVDAEYCDVVLAKALQNELSVRCVEAVG